MLALLSALAAQPSRAAWDTQFLPSVEMRVTTTQNVNVTGEVEQSDVVSQLAIMLALQADRRDTTMRFAYSPLRQSFKDFENFDNTGHQISANIRHDPRAGVSHEFQLYASRSQNQGIDPQDAGLPVSLVPRTTLERYRAQWGGSTASDRRSSWIWQVRGEANRGEDTDAVDFEDSTLGAALVGWARAVSARTNWSLRYGFQVIEFETAESFRTHNLRVQLNHAFGLYVQGVLALGTFYSDSGGSTFSDPALEASVARSGATNWGARAGIRTTVSTGSGSGGATRDGVVFVDYSKTDRSGRLSFRAEGSFTRREELDPAGGDPRDLDTLLTREEFGWNFQRAWRFGVFHSYVDQRRTAAGAAGTEPVLVAAGYHAGGLFVRWTRQRR